MDDRFERSGFRRVVRRSFAETDEAAVVVGLVKEAEGKQPVGFGSQADASLVNAMLSGVSS